MQQELEARLRRFFVHWHRQYARNFPWREPDVSPFGILIAEMLLRQTRATMVAPIWETFTACYPTPEACIEATSEELFAMLSPLGFGSQRTAAVQAVTAALIERYQGKVPRSIDRLIALPHLGLYSAHAIACFAYNRRVPVVDVNVLRLFSRLVGEDFGIDNRRGRAPEVWEMAWRILPRRNVKAHNYGLLDFCAQICTARSPRHDQCDLAPWCAYHKQVRAISNSSVIP